MANKEANKSYKEYSTNFLIDKIDKEKKKLAELYQDLYKFKEDHQRHIMYLGVINVCFHSGFKAL